MNFDYGKLGLLLKNARMRKGLKQQEVAEKLKLTSQNVSSWERGKSRMDIESFLRLCQWYEIDYVDTLNSCTDMQGEAGFVLGFSIQEGTLISNFRSLSDQGREYVLQQVDMAMRVYKKYSGVPVLEGEA